MKRSTLFFSKNSKFGCSRNTKTNFWNHFYLVNFFFLLNLIILYNLLVALRLWRRYCCKSVSGPGNSFWSITRIFSIFQVFFRICESLSSKQFLKIFHLIAGYLNVIDSCWLLYKCILLFLLLFRRV